MTKVLHFFPVRNTIQGIRMAACRYGMHLNLFSDADFDKTDFSSLPQIAIVTGTSLPFIQKAISRLRDNDRFAVLAGMDSEQFGYDVSCSHATAARRDPAADQLSVQLR